MRVGIGFDLHPFGEGRPLILGGVKISSEKGLLGHSDADCLTHALCDAFLGALGKGDLGSHFPDTDPRYKGISSLLLLEEVVKMARREGWEVENVDATIVAQGPRLAPYLSQMEERIARTLRVEPGKVNVKATSPEALGALGREEGIGALAVVLLRRG